MKQDAGKLIEKYNDDYSLYQHAKKHDHYCPRMGGDAKFNTTKGNCHERRKRSCRDLKCSSYEQSQAGEMVTQERAKELLKYDKKMRRNKKEVKL